MAAAHDQTFAQEAREVLTGIRRALADLVGSAGADPTQPQELSRRFGLDKTLSWKITRIICEDEATDLVRLMPGKNGMKIFVDAMERGGAPADRARVVHGAMDDLERFIEVHSGDRETFEIMLGGTSKDVARRRNEALRKQAFMANSGIWGVRARAQLSLHFCTPKKDDPETLVLGIICGLIDFSRLRPDAPWSVASISHFAGDNVPYEACGDQPMDPTVKVGEPPLLSTFCSDPTPVLRQASSSNGRMRYEFTEGAVGNTAAATALLGWISKDNACRFRTDLDTTGEHLSHLNTPVEIAYHDLYLHRDCVPQVKPELLLYSQMPGGPLYPRDGVEHGLLRNHEDMIDLGASPPDTTTPGLPRYREIAEFGAKSMGYNLREFQGYRMRLRYPPIPTLATFRYPLPERA